MMRQICFFPKYRTASLYKHLNILNVNNLFKYSIACYMYRTVNNISPKSIADIMFYKSLHKYSTRYAHFLPKPQYRLSLCLNNISWAGPDLWNKLPLNIKMIKQYTIFKSDIKNFLLQI